MQRRRLLFVLEGCPHCHRAEEALKKANVDFERIEVSGEDRSMIKTLSGQPTVPILVEVIGSQNQDDDIIAAIPELQHR